MREYDLYEPMRIWLDKHLCEKYPKETVITTYESATQSLYVVLDKYGLVHDLATGIDIQIDVLGIVKFRSGDYSLHFIEAKATALTLKDLGQLWAYSKLINPEEAFLLSPKGIGTLSRILLDFRREDLLQYGDFRKPKYMQVIKWDIQRKQPVYATLIPKI